MITTIIIFGANGMLGSCITRYFTCTEYKVIPVTRNEFDSMRDLLRLEDYLTSLQCDEHTCIINCTGMIPQRMKGRDENEYYIVNTIFPLQLAKISKKYGARLLCPTTDCVFTGIKGGYCETDYHDETNRYGVSKSLGEPLDATVIRTSIIGEEQYNKCSFLEFVRNSSVINGWDNHIWNGITCYQYCKLIDTILSTNQFWKGVRHVYSPQSKTKYELACIIKDVYQLSCTIHKHIAATTVDKTLVSIHESMIVIPSVEEQLLEQKQWYESKDMNRNAL
jgi:dTDP-4-dehydrorhamnose reductase